MATSDPRRARYLAGQLTAFADDFCVQLMRNPFDPSQATSAQIEAVYRDELKQELSRSEARWAEKRREADFSPETLRRDELVEAWAWTIYASDGHASCVTEHWADRMQDAGLTGKEVEDVASRLQFEVALDGPNHKTFDAEAAAQGIELTDYNRSLVHAVVASARALVHIRRSGAHEQSIAPSAKARLRATATVPFGSSSSAPASRRNSPRRAAASPEEHELAVLGLDLSNKKVADGNWDQKTASQAKQTFDLFSRILIEEGVCSVGEIEQRHLATFEKLLRELPKSYGKSQRHKEMAINDLRALGSTLPASQRGLTGATINRHLTFLGQALRQGKSQGIVLDSKIDIGLLRSSRKGRPRDQRSALDDEDVGALFQLPCFTGCADWKAPMLPGTKLFHRGLFFAPILLFYTGARREEICGLSCDDIGFEGEYRTILIRCNEIRRIKNSPSDRVIPMHPEVLRLGFIDYLEEIRQLGYLDVFPDLHSPTSKERRGDRLYKELIKGIKHVMPEASVQKKAIHSIRHTFGANLDFKDVSSSARGDLLGHVGRNEAEERYTRASRIAKKADDIAKLPLVTAHLMPFPITLLPWVRDKRTPPFSRRERRRETTQARMPPSGRADR